MEQNREVKLLGGGGVKVMWNSTDQFLSRLFWIQNFFRESRLAKKVLLETLIISTISMNQIVFDQLVGLFQLLK